MTTVTEHNAVFLSTIAAARRAGIPRIVLERGDDGSILADGDELRDAVVVVSAMDNVIGMVTPGLRDLIAAVHRAGGIVIVDAAQAAAHTLEALRGLDADAICFSAHKMYGPSLGIVIASRMKAWDAADYVFVPGCATSTWAGTARDCRSRSRFWIPGAGSARSCRATSRHPLSRKRTTSPTWRIPSR